MLNPKIKLNPDFFDKDVERQSMRKGFGRGLLTAGEFYEKVVVLCADVIESTSVGAFKDRFPNRFIEVGVSEQNMAGAASGLAAMGKIPFMISYAIFSPGRNWEQIRTTICYNNRPVKIIGSHTGVSVGPDGGSHQALEDIALMRVLPRMVVLSPSDAVEAAKCVLASVEIDRPAYIRLSRESLPVLTTDETPFKIGRAEIYYDSTGSVYTPSSIGIVATGELVHKAMFAAEVLRQENIAAKVMNLSTIKPLDSQAVISLAKDTGAVLTVEDHQIYGGMGSAVAEVLAQNYPVPMEFVGTKDCFGQSGKADELLKHYGLDESGIVEAAKRLLKKKNR